MDRDANSCAHKKTPDQAGVLQNLRRLIDRRFSRDTYCHIQA